MTEDASDASVGEPKERRDGPSFVMVPMSLLGQKRLGPNAKLLYARLRLYAAKDGVCYPSHETLAKNLGLTSRRIRAITAELQKCGLIQWRRTQKSNVYTVHPPESFVGPDRKKASRQAGGKLPIKAEENFRSGRKNASDKKMSLKTGSLKHVSSIEVKDYDCPPMNRKTRDSPAGVGVLAEYPSLRRCLREHMQETDPALPSRDKVLRIVQATGHEPEAEILQALRNLRERGYGADHVRTYAWFETALADYFCQKQDREDAARPYGYDAWEERNETRMERAKFDQLTDSF